MVVELFKLLQTYSRSFSSVHVMLRLLLGFNLVIAFTSLPSFIMNKWLIINCLKSFVLPWKKFAYKLRLDILTNIKLPTFYDNDFDNDLGAQY